jgi:hypothetical protein
MIAAHIYAESVIIDMNKPHASRRQPMRTNIFHLTLPALLACTVTFTPLPASADQEHGYGRDQHQERQIEHRNQRKTQTTPSQHVDKSASQRVGHQGSSPQRPAVIQQQNYNRYKAVPSKQDRHVKRHVETHRPIHIEPPHDTVYRHAWNPLPRQRFYRGVRIYRPYGHPYPGFGFYYDDADAFQWLAFTALAMAIIDHLDEHQQRMYEQAFIRATTAYVGDTIYWQDGHSYGSITVRSIWYDYRGRQCRNLEQSVTADGLTETRLNTVCLQPSGVWVVSDGR